MKHPNSLITPELPSLGYSQVLGHVATKNSLAVQITSEATYRDAMTIEPIAYDKDVSPEEVCYRMEVDHVVKHAPRLAEQVGDTSRTSVIERVAKIPGQPTRVTEHEALIDIDAYLDTAEHAFELDEHARLRARDLRENLTFIGAQEYHEATEGIARYWKYLLEAYPHQQIFVPVGMIARAETAGAGFAINTVKSDDYLFDSIMGHLSDDEVQRYAGRLITREDDITAASPEDLKVVLLDDWTVSGRQLIDAAAYFMESYPEFTSSIEVQLVTATEERIKTGLVDELFDKDGDSDRMSLPVRAYYLAHASSMIDTASGARVTGAHASVDYDFQNDLTSMATMAGMELLRRQSETNDGDMAHLAALQRISRPPYLAYIDRPYRKPGVVLNQKERLQTARREQVAVA